MLRLRYQIRNYPGKGMIVFGIFNYIIQAKNNASKIDGM
jgi:hypothetical protein